MLSDTEIFGNPINRSDWLRIDQTSTLPITASAENTSRKTEQEVLQINREFYQAMAGNDQAALDRIVADECVFTNERGMVFGKAHRAEVVKSGKVVYDSYSPEEIKVSVYGDAAVVTEGGTSKGSDQNHIGHFRYTRVFVKRQGRWQLVAAQKTRIAVTVSKAHRSRNQKINRSATWPIRALSSR